MAKRFYSKQIGHLMAKTPDWTAVVLFYLLFAVGVTALVVSPALKNGWPLGKIFLTGAVLGLITYGTYDLTNQATLKNWPYLVTVIDLIWGTLLTGTASLLAVLAINKFFS